MKMHLEYILNIFNFNKMSFNISLFHSKRKYPFILGVLENIHKSLVTSPNTIWTLIAQTHYNVHN
jgi:hypothetical protein